MNLQKGLNRIFILLSLVVSLFGFVFGEEYAGKLWKLKPEEAFHSMKWNEENIRKYYNFASTVVAETAEEKARIAEEDEERVKMQRKRNAENPFRTDEDERKVFILELTIDSRRHQLEEREQNYQVKIEDLPNYKKSPPQYNGNVFQETFPEALKTPAYKTWLGGAMGVLIVFFPCYGGLHLILFITKWMTNKFMVLEMLKMLDMISGGLAFLALKALVFCAGIAVIMDSRRNYYAPLEFALGLGICIVSGVVLLKAIRDYLGQHQHGTK